MDLSIVLQETVNNFLIPWASLLIKRDDIEVKTILVTLLFS